jgi:hypothetical protein
MSQNLVTLAITDEQLAAAHPDGVDVFWPSAPPPARCTPATSPNPTGFPG